MKTYKAGREEVMKSCINLHSSPNIIDNIKENGMEGTLQYRRKSRRTPSKRLETGDHLKT
jgi:hypothetical protein